MVDYVQEQKSAEVRRGSLLLLLSIFVSLACISPLTLAAQALPPEPPLPPLPALPQDFWAPVPDYGVNSIGLSFIQSSTSNWAEGEEDFFTAALHVQTNGETNNRRLQFRRFLTLNLGARYT